jgi:hypothetical protein
MQNTHHRITHHEPSPLVLTVPVCYGAEAKTVAEMDEKPYQMEIQGADQRNGEVKSGRKQRCQE